VSPKSHKATSDCQNIRPFNETVVAKSNAVVEIYL